MYVKTTKSTHYIPRTGSYSTHPHRNGRVDVLPPEAKEQLITDFHARRKRLIEMVKTAQAALTAINEERDGPLRELMNGYSIAVRKWKQKQGPRPIVPMRIESWRERARDAAGRVSQLQDQLSQLNTIIEVQRGGKDLAFVELFYELAKQMLDANTFNRILAEAKLRWAVRSTDNGDAGTSQ